MAELVAKFPGKLYGLATVNAFAGDTAAQELTRAVRDLHLRGVFLEAARGDLVLGAKELTGARGSSRARRAGLRPPDD